MLSGRKRREERVPETVRPETLAAIEAAEQAKVEASVEFVLAGPDPSPASAREHVFVEEVLA